MPKHNASSLYQWCKAQGAAHKKGTLDAEKEKLLKKLGFEWSGQTQVSISGILLTVVSN